jgi:hypothetical protein
MGRATGKVRSSAGHRKAIADFYEKIKNPKIFTFIDDAMPNTDNNPTDLG